MPTMQEYLEEMARRQALGWTPGVPSRFTAPVATSWNLPTTARTTMRQAVPKANLGDIAAASADPVRKQGVGRPRLTPEEIQRTASRQGMGTVGKAVKAIAPFAKVAGPVGLVAELLRSEPAVASTEVPPGGYFYESQAYPSMAVEEGYPNVSTLPSFDVTPDAGGAIGGVPGVQPMEKYGPSGYEGESIPPSGYRQVAPDTVIAASDFDIGPTSMAMVGTNAFGIPDRTYGPTTETVPVADPNSYPSMDVPYGYVTDPSTILDIAQSVPDPVFLPPVTDFIAEVPSSDVTTDVAPSMSGVDYSQALADAGMATVPTLPGRTPQAGYDKGPGDEFGGFDRGTIESIFDITKNTDIDFDDYWSRQEVIEDFLDAGLIDKTQASQLKGHQLQQFNDFLTHMVPALTYEMIDEVKDSGAKGWKGLIDALSKGAIIGLENVKGANISAAGGDVGTQVDAAIELVNMGIVTPDEMRESIPEMVSQVDTFKDIPAAPAKPAGPTRAELKAAAAAQRKADLARQKAAARRTKLARQALKDSQAAAARAAAASAADKLAKEKAAKAVLARLSQDRNQPSAREVAKAREVLSQIDTFGTGGQRGFMGAEIGIEDGGGYTGGDFSSGAGWE